MEASPSRSDSFSRGGKPRPAPSSERLGCADAALGESFSSSTASFIDMDPEELLFSMRWTSDDAAPGFGLGPAPRACSPLLASAGLVFSDDSFLLTPPRDESGIIDAGSASASAGSSPAFFHTARSTPASSVAGGSSSSRRPGARTLLATRRLLLRYLRFLAPLCRKARAFSSAPRCGAPAATPARRSTSSSAASSGAGQEHWCHGNADTAVRDAILHCKKSLATER